jgi:hypothetical protein
LLSKNESLGLSEPNRYTSSITPRPPLSNNITSPTNYRNVIEERQIPFRPPRRPSNNELILGTKVNWSVNSLRSRFQQQPDLVPAKIDTLYANLDSLRNQHLSSKLTR